jgi:cbb3-type cytochrome oxidase subunit 1
MIGAFCYTLTCLQGPIQSLVILQRTTHFNNWTIGHAHIAVLGFAGFIALGGLWHVLPSLDFANGNQALNDAATGDRLRSTLLVTLGTVAFTALGGVVAGELRRRSDSVLASAGMHWATNGLGVVFGLFAWRLERSRGRR